MEKEHKTMDNCQAELNELRQKVAQFNKLQAEHQKAMAAFLESESRFRTIFENADDGIILHDTEGRIIDVNYAMYKRLGYTKQEMLKMNLKDLITSGYEEKVKERVIQLEEEGVAIFESADRRKDGTAMPVEVNARTIEYKGQKIIQSVVRDITDRKMAEELIIDTLREKDIIFGEIQQRSAFITEVFSNTLDFLNDISDKEDWKAGIAAAKNRCTSITRIQNKLYQSPSFARIDMAKVTKDITKYLYTLYQAEAKNIRIRHSIKDIHMDLDRAFYSSLLINEFFSNSIRHAFPGNTSGEIKIDIRKNKGGYNLTYRDSGAGVPKSTSLQSPATFGMQLILKLVNRLAGKITMSVHEGTTFDVIF